MGIDPYGPDKDIVGILFDKFIDGLTEAVQGLLVVLLDGWIWSCKMTFPILLMAERTAAIWIKTSEQSRPSSTIFLTDSRWPMARARRFKTAFVFA